MVPAKGWHAPLDDAFSLEWVPFDSWWNKTIFADKQRKTLTRKQLILTVADQDGGAHVDPQLEETYAALVFDNSMGWVRRRGDGLPDEPMTGVEGCTVRQIAHEVLRTLRPQYRQKPASKPGALMGNMTIMEGNLDFEGFKDRMMKRPKKFGRNEECPCGSGQKYKRCHGSP